MTNESQAAGGVRPGGRVPIGGLVARRRHTPRGRRTTPTFARSTTSWPRQPDTSPWSRYLRQNGSPSSRISLGKRRSRSSGWPGPGGRTDSTPDLVGWPAPKDTGAGHCHLPMSGLTSGVSASTTSLVNGSTTSAWAWWLPPCRPSGQTSPRTGTCERCIAGMSWGASSSVSPGGRLRPVGGVDSG